MLSEQDRTPPKEAQENARKVLEWKEQYGDEVKGMEQTGWLRANMLASGDPLSENVIRRIANFRRHEKNSTISTEYKGTPWKDAGYVAWLGWGGDSAILSWAPQLVERMEAMEKKNAKEWPKKFKARFFEPGLCSYEDSNDGVILIKKQTIDKMLNSIVGKPVVVDHQDVRPENIEEHSVGYVTDAWYDDKDGWYYADFLVVDDSAKEKIVKNGYSVSCAYQPSEEAKGGTYHATDYDYEITDGEFTHLALVDNPRYEDAKIFLNSLRPQKNKAIRFIQKFKNNLGDLADYSIEIDGKIVTGRQLLNAYKRSK